MLCERQETKGPCLNSVLLHGQNTSPEVCSTVSICEVLSMRLRFNPVGVLGLQDSSLFSYRKVMDIPHTINKGEVKREVI